MLDDELMGDDAVLDPAAPTLDGEDDDLEDDDAPVDAGLDEEEEEM